MDINGGKNFRHRKSPSSDLFLGLFTFSSPSSDDLSGYELSEADLFWTGGNGGVNDSSESTRSPHSPKSRRNLGFHRQEKPGILAAFPDDCMNRFSTPFRAIPKPRQRVSDELTQSTPSRLFQHSAPVNVPKMMIQKKPKRIGVLDELDKEENEEDDDDGMLPPHEIVALKLKSTSSVLEGVGRTLKGRDMRQVRNAVLRQTGFLD
ncbi:protein S40-7-like [Amaranthus tricolor]|uniref:protein S40-7-like n=1 Tax=Amaranthus tricolor TaxID=29722 RepID=UPI00258E28FB|nr:protein S40-7-like [Amaranthus tricolor]